MAKRQNNLAKGKGTGLALPNQRGGSLENIDNEADISIPRLKMLQPSSEEVTTLSIKAGNFFNKITSEDTDELQMVPMYMFKQRILFDKDTDEISCRSDNSVICSQGMNESQKCSDCEFGKWNKNPKTGESTPPPCRLSNNFLVYTPEDIDKIKKSQFVFPKVLSFAKTGYQCSKDIISTALFQGKDLYNFAFSLVTVMKKKDKYTYFVPTIKQYKELPADVVSKLSEIFPQMRGLVGHVEIDITDVTDTGTDA